MVLRFQKETLNFEHVLEGSAATMYPALLQLRTVFGAQPFSPKELTHATGVSRATACRLIDRLYRVANAIQKRAMANMFFDRGGPVRTVGAEIQGRHMRHLKDTSGYLPVVVSIFISTISVSTISTILKCLKNLFCTCARGP